MSNKHLKKLHEAKLQVMRFQYENAKTARKKNEIEVKAKKMNKLFRKVCCNDCAV